jgi:FkbM family methyltransferase
MLSATPDSDDSQFQHFSKKQRIVAWISKTFFDKLVYRSRQGLTTGLLRKGGLAFIPESLVAPEETEETRFWKRLDLKDRIVYDVGAFHGLLTCFFAKQARHVVAYEPTPPTYDRLAENVRLNEFRNVTLRKCGVSEVPGILTISWDPLTPGAASLRDPAAELPPKLRSERVPVVRLDQDRSEQGLPFPDFIKIDVEGRELDVLRSLGGILASDTPPSLFLEMHGETMNEKRQKTAAIVAYLRQVGYRNIQHVESGVLVDETNSEVAVRGHLYCQPN